MHDTLQQTHLREDGMRCSAEFSLCSRFRYCLWREWDENRPGVVFVMLNPSTADAMEDDPTIRRCIGYAKQWGFGSLTVVNLFALKSTDPNQLYEWAQGCANPIGDLNDYTINRILRYSHNKMVVCAWGNHGELMGRGESMKYIITSLGHEPHILKLTGKNQPSHPLYLKKDLTPQPWKILPR